MNFPPSPFESPMIYLQRASKAIRACSRKGIAEERQSFWRSAAASSCKSFLEAFKRTLGPEGLPAKWIPKDELEKMITSANDLPWQGLIVDVRDVDMHHEPIPASPQNSKGTMTISRPGRGMKLTSRCKGEGATVMMHLSGPEIRKTSQAGAEFDPGSTVMFAWHEGELDVYDYRIGRMVNLDIAITEFLNASEELLSVAQTTYEGNLRKPR